MAVFVALRFLRGKVKSRPHVSVNLVHGAGLRSIIQLQPFSFKPFIAPRELHMFARRDVLCVLVIRYGAGFDTNVLVGEHHVDGGRAHVLNALLFAGESIDRHFERIALLEKEK